MSISFFFTEWRFRPKHLIKRRNWILDCIALEGFYAGKVKFIFCSDEYLLAINQEFLNHSYFTDVITFSEGDRECLSGEVYISVERIRDNAKLYKVSVDEELNRVIIHGVLHLMGYNDSKKALKAAMTRKENLFLAKF